MLRPWIPVIRAGQALPLQSIHRRLSGQFTNSPHGLLLNVGALRAVASADAAKWWRSEWSGLEPAVRCETYTVPR